MTKLHTITFAKRIEDGKFDLGIHFDDGFAVVDLSAMLAQGGVFTPLRDPARFAAVEVGPRGRSIFWQVGEDVVDLCADALWLMAHPAERSAAAE
jgi:hypothetical protein